MYVVININGRQYKTSLGEVLKIDKVPKKPGETVEFDQIMLLVDNDKVQIGQPFLSGVKVAAKVLEQIKGEKIRVARFKAKVRYRRVKGFRPLFTKVQIEKITTSETKRPTEAPKRIVKKKNG